MYTQKLVKCSILALTVAAACSMSGCAIFRGESAGDLAADSVSGQTRLVPQFRTAAYRAIDENTAEIYLTDLPAERFTSGKDTFFDAQGSIMHIHIFLVPSAGDTPIEQSACNVTIRHLVIAGPSAGPGISDTPVMGLYAGGGFVDPRDSIGDSSMGGSINAASHRLTRSTRDFKDLLGPGTLAGRFNAPRDEDLALAIGAKLESLVRRLPPSDLNAPEPKKSLPKPKSVAADAAKTTDAKSTDAKTTGAKPTDKPSDKPVSKP